MIAIVGIDHKDGIDDDELKAHQEQNAQSIDRLSLIDCSRSSPSSLSFLEGGSVFTGVGSVSPMSVSQNARSSSSGTASCGKTSSDMTMLYR